MAAVALALASSSPGQSANTWSGTWVNSAPDGSFWVFSQSGASVGGVWKGSGSSGTLSGTVSGSTLTGTLTNFEAGQSASFSITLAADGHSFSGTFTISGGATGQWTSACSGGACLSNAVPPAAPPAPPAPPVVPTTPAAPLPPRVLAAAATWGQLGPATALEPGGQAVASSPPIAENQRGVTVTLSGDVSGETALVVGVPTRRPGGRITGGDCVRAALGRIHTAQYVRELYSDPDLTTSEQVYLYTTFMIACLDAVKQLEQQAHAQPAVLITTAAGAASSCKARALPLSVTFHRAAKTVTYRTKHASRHDPARRLRLSCQKARNGTTTLRIRTASRRVKLRKVLGSRLFVGAYRSTTATGAANVRATFKRR
ncbi:MAG TPA: hypothetical protein VF257_01195 [Solirubrobacteraceae bacterium]